MYHVNLSVQSTNYNLTILFIGFGDGQTLIPGEERNEYSDHYVGGIGCSENTTTHRTTTDETQFLLPSIAVFTGAIEGDTNNITGSTNYAGNAGIDTDINFRWNFQRSKAPQ